MKSFIIIKNPINDDKQVFNFAVKCLPGNYLIINNYIDSMIDHRFRRSKDLFIDNDRQEVIVHCQKYFQKTCISMYYHNKKLFTNYL